MTQPTPYRRGYDFSDAGGAQPPGGPLDGELNNLALTTSQILRNLALLQRDDTGLRNGIVGIDALDSRVLGLISGGTFSIEGTWQTATAYPAGAFLTDDGAIYLVMEAHTSTSIVDDLAAGRIAKALQNEQGTRLRDDFIGNAVQTAYALSQTPARPSDVEVYVNGALVPPDEYIQTGATVTFDVAPANGAKISIFSITWATAPPIQTLVDAVGDRNTEISAATQFLDEVGIGGAALVDELAARPTTAALASPGGAALIGTTGGGNLQDAVQVAANPTALIASTKTLAVGSIVRTADGFLYKVAPVIVANHHLITAGGAKLYVLSDRKGIFNVMAFGAIGDGDADDTVPIHKAFTAAIASTTNPAEWNGVRRVEWGQTTVYFPKGKYKVTGGYTTLAMVIGFKIAGAGKMGSAIEYHNDADAFFKCNIHNGLCLSDISIIHVAQNLDRQTWTNHLLDLGGNGGGRTLHHERIETRGFNRIVRYRDDVNCDTFFASHSDYMYFNEFLWARNAQAMINKFSLCTWHGYGDGFNIAGYGHTTVDTCNVTLDGSFLVLFGAAELWGDTAHYTLINTKWEPTHWEAGESNPLAKSRSALWKLAGNKAFVECSIKMINCGMISGYNLDPDYQQMEVTSNMRVAWQGGTLKPTARILLTPLTINHPTRSYHRGLFFEGLVVVPPPSQIDRSAATDSASYPQVVYEECGGVPNICIGSPGGAGGVSTPVTMDRPQQIMQLGSGDTYYALLSSGPAKIVSQLVYGARQEIEDIIVDIVIKDVGTLLIEVSLDNFATTLDSFDHPETGLSEYPAGVSLKALGLTPTAIGKIAMDGVYVRCSGAYAVGRIYVKIRAR